MTKKLRIRFIIFSMLALIIMQGLIIFFSAHKSYNKMIDNADGIIASVYNAYPRSADVDARYFVVTFRENGTVSDIDLSHIVTVKRKGADAYAKNALNSGNDRGFIDIFRYNIFREQEKTVVVFLARGGNIEAFKSNTASSILFSSVGLGIMFLFLLAASYWVTRPIALSYQKQKEFVTSASHEMKTPLTVISADADILLMENEDNEWLKDIRAQANRLTNMTHSLISLARMDEQNIPITCIEFPVSDIAEDVAKSYQALAVKGKKNFNIKIVPNLSYCGDENMIRQLFTILLDNAFKYSKENGLIDFSLQQSSHNIVITVTNTSDHVSKEQISRFFDRFYRSDNAVSSKKNGYGLGLSIADAIVKSHKGKISAKTPENGLIQIIAVLR